MSWWVWIPMALTGALGALARWRLDLAVRGAVTAHHQRRTALVEALAGAGDPGRFTPLRRLRLPDRLLPLSGIVAVNVLGCLLAGIAGPLLVASADLRALVATGFLGGFTTFSTAVVDVWNLAREGRVVTATVLLVGVWVVGVAACALGLLLGGALAG